MIKFVVSVMLFIFSVNAHSALTDIKFGRYQIADSQWNVNACLNTTTCQIYSKQPGTAYKIPWTSGQISWAAGDYIKFELSGNASYPYLAKQYDSLGQLKATVGTGKIVNMGPDYFFFVGNDNNTGQLFSGSSGMSDTGGVSWTGTLNPTIAQADAYANANYSTEPLGAGQTATTTPNNAGGGGGSPVYSSNITAAQQTRVNVWTAKTITDNGIYIDQVGDNNSLTIVQTGNKNLITGIGQQAAKIQGDQNIVTINQGVTGAGQNEIGLRLIGNLNTINIGQARDNTGTAIGGNGHYLSLDVYGSSNNITTQQSNLGGVGGHYMETTISGNSNIITNKQLDNGNKIMFGTVTNGSNNNVTAVQQGTGQHYLDYKLTGNSHTANINQTGSAQNKATIDLTNAGGAATLNLTQNGNQIFSITQSCSMVGGCATTVVQP